MKYVAETIARRKRDGTLVALVVRRKRGGRPRKDSPRMDDTQCFRQAYDEYAAACRLEGRRALPFEDMPPVPRTAILRRAQLIKQGVVQSSAPMFTTVPLEKL